MRATGLWRLSSLILLLTLVAVPLSLPATTASAVPVVFNGAGTIDATGALGAFRTAIGGVNNGGAPPPAAGGRREINWDGVALDGSIPGSVVIVPGQNVGIPTDLFQTRGVTLDRIHSVSGDGFVSVNPGVVGQFPAFSPTRTFASFNNNVVIVNFVLASARGTAAVPAATRGFGAIFLDVETANSSSIEYFAGTTSLGRFFVPPGPTSQPEFLGVLFDAPVVTSVRITTGAGTLFSFTTPPSTPGSPDITINPVTGIDQAALDDFVYAEPTAIVVPTAVVAPGPPPPSSGQAGVPCAGAAGQTCTVAGGVTGNWTEGATHPFFLTATGPALTAPGSTPTVFLPTTTGVESFPCTRVGPAAPFTTVCQGVTVGDLLQGATVTVRFALFGGGFLDVTGTVTGPGPASVTLAQAIASVTATGQQNTPCANRAGQTCQAAGGVNGPGSVTGSMRWTLTANVPVGVAPGIVPVAVFSTTQGIQGFPCAPVVAGVTTVACSGTTAGNALQGSTVTVVFAPGVTSTGTITGPGAAAVVIPVLPPPPPPPPLPPPPLLLPPPPFAGQGGMGMEMPARPTATPTPATDARRPAPSNMAAQPSNSASSASAPQPSASASQPAASGATQALPAGAPPARPVAADVAPTTPATDAGPLIPAPAAMPTTLSPTAPDGTTDPASMMPAAPEEVVSSVATAPSDADGDDTLQDLPVQP
jgi:hypothetical protein